MDIILAKLEHLTDVAPLFNQYRVFYHQPSDLSAARQFMAQRLQQQDSAIFLAVDQGDSVGFTQLYPSFSSVSMQRIWILNDLYVIESHRRQGVAKQLMQAAAAYGRGRGAVSLKLATQTTNTIALRLYASLGYQQDREFEHFSLPL